MALPAVGDGQYVGDGNTNETLNIGRSTQAVTIGASTGTVTLGAIAASPVLIGGLATAKVGFYGKTPVVIRPYSSAVHATSAASVSSSFGATQLAILQELMNTNVGLGLYATA